MRFFFRIVILNHFEKNSKNSMKGILSLNDIKTWEEDAPNLVSKYHPSSKIKAEYPPNPEINSKISILLRGDSTKLKIDAIVNAANSSLSPGGGICGAIHSAAGSQLADECHKIGHCPTGQSVLTNGYDLPAKYVIQTVGPIGEDPEALTSAYNSVYSLIDGIKIRSVGLCCISTGIYGYPITPATHIALKTARDFLEDPNNRAKTDRIIFVVFLARDCSVYMQLIHQYFPLDFELNVPIAKLESSTSESDSEIDSEEEDDDFFTPLTHEQWEQLWKIKKYKDYNTK